MLLLMNEMTPTGKSASSVMRVCVWEGKYRGTDDMFVILCSKMFDLVSRYWLGRFDLFEAPNCKI